MAMQIVEFPASSGLTLTAKLYPFGSDAAAQVASATVESTNRKGVYQATFTGRSGNYLLVAEDANNIPCCIDPVIGMTDTAATFQTESIAAPATSSGGTVGPGATPCVINISHNGVPIAQCEVWLTSDQAGTTTVAGTLTTDSNGDVTFMLDVGNTYYIWARRDGFNPARGVPYVATAG